MLGIRLRALRKSQGLTLADVAAVTGLSVSFLSDVERGRGRPSIETLQKLAKLYDADLSIQPDDVGLAVHEATAQYLPGWAEFVSEVNIEPELADLLLSVEKRSAKPAETKQDWLRLYYSLKSMLGK